MLSPAFNARTGWYNVYTSVCDLVPPKIYELALLCLAIVWLYPYITGLTGWLWDNHRHNKTMSIFHGLYVWQGQSTYMPLVTIQLNIQLIVFHPKPSLQGHKIIYIYKLNKWLFLILKLSDTIQSYFCRLFYSKVNEFIWQFKVIFAFQWNTTVYQRKTTGVTSSELCRLRWQYRPYNLRTCNSGHTYKWGDAADSCWTLHAKKIAVMS